MSDASPARAPSPRRVVFAGNPNAGKTTLFNAATGARAKVANYPGVTVDRRSAKVALRTGERIELVDLPGTYSLTARSPEEQVAADSLFGRAEPAPDAVVVVVDATALRRGLYLALQVIEIGLPTVVVLTMTDEAKRRGLAVDSEDLAARLGCTVLTSERGRGSKALLEALESPVPGQYRDGPTEPWLDTVVQALPSPISNRSERAQHAYARWAVVSLGDDELADVPDSLRVAVTQVSGEAEADGTDLARDVIEQRYARVDEIVSEPIDDVAPSWSDRVDRFVLHPLSGFCLFLFTMGVLFQGLFAWSEPAISAVETLVLSVQSVVRVLLPPGPVADLAADGVVAGVGNVLVFVPQIAILFLFIGFLEDSGYLARVAFVLDRIMGGVGLHGRAFVPMLSGFACAVPAVVATRTIENRRDRLLTMLVVPLTSCSARLPVYVLITAVVFDPTRTWVGPVRTGAAILFALYAASIALALASAWVLRRTVLRGPRPSLVLELPPYRWPSALGLLRSTYERVRTFVVDAGTVILAMTVVLWVLLSYPRSEEIEHRYAAMIDDVPQAAIDRETRVTALEDAKAAEQLANSYGGRFGRLIEPLLRPMGQDWRVGVAIVGAFAAREVFVGTLAIVWGIGEADEADQTLRSSLRAATWPDGSTLFTPLSGAALLVFFLLACQCMSTIAAVKRESGGWRWAVFLFVYMTALAYGASVLVYQVGWAYGWGLG